jgi:glyceraldehyde-3-phosphate dehydrogenase (NADP+)
VVTGRGSRIGDLLVQHPAVDMISFTGSSETGKELARKAGMVPLMLELGGKDAAIVLGDADLDATAADIVAGAFSYSGQRCTAVKRVLVVESVADELAQLIEKRVRALTVGDPRDDAAVTPLVDPGAAEATEALVRQAVDMGARLVVGGGRKNNLMEPTLVDHVKAGMDLAWVEPFAPVLPIIRVTDAAHAVKLANASEYGLQAAVFSRDVDAAMHISLALDVGTVQINGRTARGPDHFPFLGTKASGMGTQGVRFSIEAMTRLKSTVFNMRPMDLSTLQCPTTRRAQPRPAQLLCLVTTERDDRSCTIPQPSRAARRRRARRDAASSCGSRCATVRPPSSGSRPGSEPGHIWVRSTRNCANWCGRRVCTPSASRPDAPTSSSAGRTGKPLS